jgi:phenylpropionate dioxygenase-like ring-hydroxylating dioxygenase large terminal subunit
MKLELERSLLARAARHIEAGTTDLAAHALRVSAGHYASPEQLERELRALFRERPLLVALSPDLPDPGSFLAQDAAGVPLLLMRGEDGRARAFVNACRHRGARLATGRGQARRLVCPFHAWTYDLEGRVRSRPLSCGGFDGLDASFDRLLELPCREVAGMIFVLLSGGDVQRSVDALIGGVEAEIADFAIGDHVFFAARSIERPCNYKLIVDGFAESYHLKVLHKDTIAPYYYAAPGLVDPIGAVTRMIGVRKSIDAELARPPDEQRFVRHGTIQYLIPPNAVLVHQVDHVEFWQVHPLAGEPGRCRAELRLYWPAPLDTEARRKAELNLEVLWNVTTTEDMPQAERIHAALASGALPELVFGRNEPALIHYHEAIEAAAAGGGITACRPAGVGRA